jgi:hypothetical protein
MTIKTLKQNTFILLLFTFISCTKDTDDANGNKVANLGTFVGNLQVSDDPQTNLGYVYNTKVNVSTTGNNAIIKIIGDNGFDREFTGTVFNTSTTSTIINITKQIKPTEKNVGNNLVVTGNALSIDISIASDNVTTKATPTSTSTINISGKVRLLGSNLLKE